MTIPADGTGNTTATLSSGAAGEARAPSPPAFFKMQLNDRTLLEGASQFPDPRQSYFLDSTAVALDPALQIAREQAHSRPDALTPLWLLTLLGVLLASWREAAKQ